MLQGNILLPHGGGGRLSHELVQDMVLPILDNPELRRMQDSSRIPETGGRMVMTTDSFVVTPHFFPGGDIGKIAVCGTVNDLATAGARPLALSLAMVLEEGFSMELLRKILESMRTTADTVPVSIITGDTKVVEKGKGDGVYLCTTGVGIVSEGIELCTKNVRPDDLVLINGAIGNHEACILCARTNFFSSGEIMSDCAPLYGLMHDLLEAVPDVRFARDATRGGLASVITELTEDSGYGITLEEEAILVDKPVQSVCELLGLDPLMMANEGKMVVVVPPEKGESALAAMQRSPYGKEARIIGKVHDRNNRLTIKTIYGTTRVVVMPVGNQLPRIC